MSDFDDEPTEGLEATDEPEGAAEAAPAAERPKKDRPEPAPDDDWDDDWDDEDTGGAKRDLTLVYAIVAAAIVIVLAVVLTRPDDSSNTPSDGGNGNAAATTEAAPPSKNWQGPVGDAVGKDGEDAQKRAESAPGIYIWTGFDGWHIRQNGSDNVTVTVTAPKVRTGGADDAPFEAQAEVTLPPGNGSEGVDLDLGDSETATFTITIDGTNVPAGEIFLGGAEGVADANPVTFTKA